MPRKNGLGSIKLSDTISDMNKSFHISSRRLSTDREIGTYDSNRGAKAGD